MENIKIRSWFKLIIECVWVSESSVHWNGWKQCHPSSNKHLWIMRSNTTPHRKESRLFPVNLGIVWGRNTRRMEFIFCLKARKFSNLMSQAKRMWPVLKGLSLAKVVIIGILKRIMTEVNKRHRINENLWLNNAQQRQKNSFKIFKAVI